ncbi:MAG: hypothetical protein KAR44_03570 [Candidatus Aegiribacteria sp.]|nr:hypothetical protein [Candidatus Aegiribacteria sp.]
MKTVSLFLLTFTFTVMAEDFEWSSGGAMGTVNTMVTIPWNPWVITSVENNTGFDLILTTIAFPCCGGPSGSYGWLVWTDVGGLVAPSGDVTTCDYHGPYTPVDPGPSMPPFIYTYVDVSSENIIIPAGNFFCFGYDVTQYCGQIPFNGVDSWSWWNNMWIPDQGWLEATALIEVYANFYTALEQTTWGGIKTILQ